MKLRLLSSRFQNEILTSPSGTHFFSLLIDLTLMTLGLIGAILFVKVQMEPLRMDRGDRGDSASYAGAAASKLQEGLAGHREHR
jgi:hypothetical protein